MEKSDNLTAESLPQAFRLRMQKTLGGDYETFLSSYEEAPSKGLRVNLRKAPDFACNAPFTLQPVPWAEGGYFYQEQDRPGRHPLHEAGVYYIQEPSAMIAAAAADWSEGERVLDLCAAPGGKTTAIADRMRGKGLIVANEIVPSRADILARNVERMGIVNCVVTNASPAELADRWEGYFDKILVDAPCSGEGMFRKNPEAVGEWSPQVVAMCAQRQEAILQSARRLLRPGGTIVYSTCTFSPEENESVIARFVETYPEFRIADAALPFTGGDPRLACGAIDGLEKCVRFYPHERHGEGHFAAVLKSEGGGEPVSSRDAPIRPDRRQTALWEAWRKENLTVTQTPDRVFGSRLLSCPPTPNLRGIKVLRAGLELGETIKDRFVPAHALALALAPSDARRRLELRSDSPDASAYLRGETIACPFKGWGLVCVDGYSLGWCKGDGSVAKNHYPKGLRRRIER